MMCEIDPAARRVLDAQFAGVDVAGDVTQLASFPKCDILAAGFPCQDLSQAGRMAGIQGAQSGLVGSLFRLVGRSRPRPQWIVMENVPFMLRLNGGHAMTFLTTELESLGYRWAYRIIDTRAFGLPHRRRRVILVGSRSGDPKSILLSEDEGESAAATDTRPACGFYWTEGNTGLGWAVDAIPPLKGGSSLGIASPPAIWLADGRFVTPDIRDAERLQGFAPGWTKAALHPDGKGRSARWKLVGNAVSVPVGSWVAGQILRGHEAQIAASASHDHGGWGTAGWGEKGRRTTVLRSMWPAAEPVPHLADFLSETPHPLSLRAASGFLRRASAARLKFAEGFLDSLRTYVDGLGDQSEAA